MDDGLVPWFAVAGVALLLALLLAALLHRRGWRPAPPAPTPRAVVPTAPPAPEETTWCYLRDGEVPRGPVTTSGLLAMLADGRLAPSALAAPATRNDWRPLSQWLDGEPSMPSPGLDRPR